MDGQNVAQNSLRRIIYLSIYLIYLRSRLCWWKFNRAKVTRGGNSNSNEARKFPLIRTEKQEGWRREENGSRRRIRFLDECGRNASAPTILQRKRSATCFWVISDDCPSSSPDMSGLCTTPKDQERGAQSTSTRITKRPHHFLPTNFLINAHAWRRFVVFFLSSSPEWRAQAPPPLKSCQLFWAYRGLAHNQLLTRPITKKWV